MTARDVHIARMSARLLPRARLPAGDNQAQPACNQKRPVRWPLIEPDHKLQQQGIQP